MLFHRSIKVCGFVSQTRSVCLPGPSGTPDSPGPTGPARPARSPFSLWPLGPAETINSGSKTGPNQIDANCHDCLVLCVLFEEPTPSKNVTGAFPVAAQTFRNMGTSGAPAVGHFMIRLVTRLTYKYCVIYLLSGCPVVR
jgi:hypothetical protein